MPAHGFNGHNSSAGGRPGRPGRELGLASNFFRLLKLTPVKAGGACPAYPARVPYELLDADGQRHEIETRSETGLQGGQAIGLGLLLVLHLANHRWPFLPFNAPWTLFACLILGAVVAAMNYLWLKTRPPYRAYRKFLLTGWEATLYATAVFSVSMSLPPPLKDFAGFVPLPIFMVITTFSGLRYSPGVVLMMGGYSITLQIAFAHLILPWREAMMVTVGDLVYQGTITLVTSLVVFNLLRLQREGLIRRRLERFLSPELVSEVVRNPALLGAQTRRAVATVMFVDVRGFTALSEHHSPEEVVGLLNRFLQETTQAVAEHGGMVDKFIGDSVMALFGVNGATAQVDDALRAALSLRERMAAVNRLLAEEHRPQLAHGVGIHTGPLVLGAIGSGDRFDYTAIGDTVNVAARIQGLTRQFGVDILLSQQSRALLAGTFELAAMEAVHVRGREEPVAIWACKGRTT